MGARQVIADYPEEAVGMMIDSFLTGATWPRQRVSVELFSKTLEHQLGADARLVGHIAGFKPFYMQFKRPLGYFSDSTSKLVRDRKHRSPPLRTEPVTMYFGLRDKAPTHSEYQHNILHALRESCQPAGSDAAYVCPLFFRRDVYRTHIHLASMREWRRGSWLFGLPWRTGPVSVADGATSINFTGVPLLREHVTIPPHRQVTSSNHSYSFADSGDEVCFHSPEEVREGPITLDKWLTRIADGVFSGESMIPREMAAEELGRFVERVLSQTPLSVRLDTSREAQGILSWMELGYSLEQEYGIRQYAFVHWSDEGSQA